MKKKTPMDYDGRYLLKRQSRWPIILTHSSFVIGRVFLTDLETDLCILFDRALIKRVLRIVFSIPTKSVPKVHGGIWRPNFADICKKTGSSTFLQEFLSEV